MDSYRADAIERRTKYQIVIDSNLFTLTAILFKDGELLLHAESAASKHEYQMTKTAKDILEFTKNSKMELEPSALYRLILESVDKDINTMVVDWDAKEQQQSFMFKLIWHVVETDNKFDRVFEFQLDRLEISDADRMSKMMLEMSQHDFVSQTQLDECNQTFKQLQTELSTLRTNSEHTVAILKSHVDKIQAHIDHKDDTISQLQQQVTSLQPQMPQTITVHNGVVTAYESDLKKEINIMKEQLMKLSHESKQRGLSSILCANLVNVSLYQISETVKKLFALPLMKFKINIKRKDTFLYIYADLLAYNARCGYWKIGDSTIPYVYNVDQYHVSGVTVAPNHGTGEVEISLFSTDDTAVLNPRELSHVHIQGLDKKLYSTVRVDEILL